MSRNQNSQLPPKPFGIVLSGTVVDRTRRHVPKDYPTTEIVTYTLSDGYERKYFIDDFSPSEYHSAVSDNLSIVSS